MQISQGSDFVFFLKKNSFLQLLLLFLFVQTYHSINGALQCLPNNKLFHGCFTSSVTCSQNFLQISSIIYRLFHFHRITSLITFNSLSKAFILQLKKDMTVIPSSTLFPFVYNHLNLITSPFHLTQ